MNKRELIEALEKFPDDMPVLIAPNGFVYDVCTPVQVIKTQRMDRFQSKDADTWYFAEYYFGNRANVTVVEAIVLE